MKFTKKIKIRMIIGVIYTLLGISIIVIANLLRQDDTLFSFGTIFTVMGIARFLQYYRILKNPILLKNRQIEETDERNVMIVTKARSLAFTIYILSAALSIIVCYILNQQTAAKIIAYAVCIFVAIYWICYFIIKRKY